MILRRITRLTGLLIATLGFLGAANAVSGESEAAHRLLLVWFFLLVIGCTTVFGLKRVWLRIPAGLMNVVLAFIGLYWIAVIPDGTDPEIRRMIGVFCLLVGAVNAFTLLAPRFAPRADEQPPDAASELLSRAMELERQGNGKGVNP